VPRADVPVYQHYPCMVARSTSSNPCATNRCWLPTRRNW
jgi:hypothetical protein